MLVVISVWMRVNANTCTLTESEAHLHPLQSTEGQGFFVYKAKGNIIWCRTGEICYTTFFLEYDFGLGVFL